MTPLANVALRDAETRARRAALRRYSAPGDFRLYAAVIERIDFASQHLPADDAIREITKIYDALGDKHHGNTDQLRTAEADDSQSDNPNATTR